MVHKIHCRKQVALSTDLSFCAFCIMGFSRFWLNMADKKNQGTSPSNPRDISHDSKSGKQQVSAESATRLRQCIKFVRVTMWAASWQNQTKWYMYVRPAKTQISLGIRPVWSESLPLMCSFLQADSEDSDQDAQLIRVFAGGTSHFVGFVTMRLIWFVLFLSYRQYTIIDYWGIGHEVMSTREYQYWPRRSRGRYWYSLVDITLCPMPQKSTIVLLYNIINMLKTWRRWRGEEDSVNKDYV